MDEIWDLIESVSEGSPTCSRYPVRQDTYVSTSPESGRAAVSYWRKNVHLKAFNS